MIFSKDRSAESCKEAHESARLFQRKLEEDDWDVKCLYVLPDGSDGLLAMFLFIKHSDNDQIPNALGMTTMSVPTACLGDDFNPRDFEFEKLRCHYDMPPTVRATHIPSGLSASCSDWSELRAREMTVWLLLARSADFHGAPPILYPGEALKRSGVKKFQPTHCPHCHKPIYDKPPRWRKKVPWIVTPRRPFN
jgi:hypothetical protein